MLTSPVFGSFCRFFRLSANYIFRLSETYYKPSTIFCQEAGKNPRKIVDGDLRFML